MKILMTGASGFIGRRLGDYLGKRGHTIVPLTRGSAVVASEPSWDPKTEQIDLAPAGEFDAVIHLAGENIAQRWNEQVKERIYQSRVRGTGLLSRALASLPKRPKVMISASGAAYYGDRGDEILDERSAPGTGFLVKVTQDWEGATEAAAAAGIRVVYMRIGVVLHPAGGALAKMLPLFRVGLGGKLGSGKQYWSWIALPDVLAAIEFLLQRPDVSGPVNMVGPNPVTNEQFTEALGAVLRRPSMFGAPAFALRLMVGEMANEALLASFRMIPARLSSAGFVFKHPELKSALAALLDHPAP